jgi:hypothetical protein
MDDEVPEIAPKPEPLNDGQESAEQRLLLLGSQLQGLLAEETSQRIWLKWIASAVGCLVIVGMSALLWHSMHMMWDSKSMFPWWPWPKIPSGVAVAVFVAPVVSITTITVALFVASFRRFEDKDLETAGSSIVGGVGIARGGT